MQRVASARPNYLQYLAEADFAQSESVVWHLRVAEGDHLNERSEGGKLPKHRTRALDVLRKLKTFLGGASGGMQGGPRRGRSPITGPALPPPEAAQTTNKKWPPCPQGTKIPSQRTSPVSLPLPHRYATSNTSRALPTRLKDQTQSADPSYNEASRNNRPPFLRLHTAPPRRSPPSHPTRRGALASHSI